MAVSMYTHFGDFIKRGEFAGNQASKSNDAKGSTTEAAPPFLLGGRKEMVSDGDKDQ